MRAHPRNPAVFGPFDGDFDPFDEDDEFGVLITFGLQATVMPGERDQAAT